jgi:hypothetical protein
MGMQEGAINMQMATAALENTLKSEGEATRRAISGKQETHFHWSNGELVKSVKNGNSWSRSVSNFHS